MYIHLIFIVEIKTRNNEMTTQQQTIETLGGLNKLSVMINARNFTNSTPDDLTFHFSGSKIANIAKIELENDLYSVTLYKAGKSNCKEVETLNGIYADQLKGVFEERTNLRLSL